MTGPALSRRLVFGGMTTLDLVHLVDVLPELGAKRSADTSSFDVGGPAANAAITAAELGGEVTLRSVLGRGPLPDFARRVLADHNIEARDHAPAGAQLPVASIWIDGAGERTILATDNATVQVEVLTTEVLPEGTAAVLIDGHYPALSRAVAAAAAAARVPIVLDCGRWRPVYADLLPMATDIIMCETFRPPEFAALPTEEAVIAIQQKWQPELCAATRGATDIVLVNETGHHAIPVPEVAVVDTMGAGDVFHGAYIYQRYVGGRDVISSLQLAAESASESCTRLGVRDSVD